MLTLTIIILFATLIGLACIYGILFPQNLIARINAIWQEKSGMYMAVAIRLILGLHLIAIAPFSKFPLAIKILGFIAIAAAVVIPIIGRKRIGNLLKWFEKAPEMIVRLWLFVGLIFAGFILYAVI